QDAIRCYVLAGRHREAAQLFSKVSQSGDIVDSQQGESAAAMHYILSGRIELATNAVASLAQRFGISVDHASPPRTWRHLLAVGWDLGVALGPMAIVSTCCRLLQYAARHVIYPRRKARVLTRRSSRAHVARLLRSLEASAETQSPSESVFPPPAPITVDTDSMGRAARPVENALDKEKSGRLFGQLFRRNRIGMHDDSEANRFCLYLSRYMAIFDSERSHRLLARGLRLKFNGKTLSAQHYALNSISIFAAYEQGPLREYAKVLLRSLTAAARRSRSQWALANCRTTYVFQCWTEGRWHAAIEPSKEASSLFRGFGQSEILDAHYADWGRLWAYFFTGQYRNMHAVASRMAEAGRARDDFFVSLLLTNGIAVAAWLSTDQLDSVLEFECMNRDALGQPACPALVEDKRQRPQDWVDDTIRDTHPSPAGTGSEGSAPEEPGSAAINDQAVTPSPQLLLLINSLGRIIRQCFARQYADAVQTGKAARRRSQSRLVGRVQIGRVLLAWMIGHNLLYEINAAGESTSGIGANPAQVQEEIDRLRHEQLPFASLLADMLTARLHELNADVDAAMRMYRRAMRAAKRQRLAAFQEAAYDRLLVLGNEGDESAALHLQQFLNRQGVVTADRMRCLYGYYKTEE
ncbi:MAG: hypothetical protein AAFP90_02880, partial [Planctomycetota bacterium]